MKRVRHNLAVMESACEWALGHDDTHAAWMEQYCQVCDPASVKHVILQLRESQQCAPLSQDDLHSLGRLVNALTLQVKRSLDYSDPSMDDLLLMARQLLARLRL